MSALASPYRAVLVSDWAGATQCLVAMCNLDLECAASVKLSMKRPSRSSCGAKSEAHSAHEAAAAVFHAVASEWSGAVRSSVDDQRWSLADMDLACPASFSDQVAGCRKLCTLKLFRRLSEVVQPGVRLSLAKSCHDSSHRQCALSSGRVA